MQGQAALRHRRQQKETATRRSRSHPLGRNYKERALRRVGKTARTGGVSAIDCTNKGADHIIIRLGRGGGQGTGAVSVAYTYNSAEGAHHRIKFQQLGCLASSLAPGQPWGREAVRATLVRQRRSQGCRRCRSAPPPRSCRRQRAAPARPRARPSGRCPPPSRRAATPEGPSVLPWLEAQL